MKKTGSVRGGGAGARAAGGTGEGGGLRGVRLLSGYEGRGSTDTAAGSSSTSPLHHPAGHLPGRRHVRRALHQRRRLQAPRRRRWRPACSTSGSPTRTFSPYLGGGASYFVLEPQPRQHQQRARLVRRGRGRHQDPRTASASRWRRSTASVDSRRCATTEQRPPRSPTRSTCSSAASAPTPAWSGTSERLPCRADPGTTVGPGAACSAPAVSVYTPASRRFRLGSQRSLESIARRALHEEAARSSCCSRACSRPRRPAP